MKSNNRNSAVYVKLFLLVLITGALSSGCSKSNNTTTTQGGNEVFIQDFAFSPSTITVSVNATVTWTNKDGVAHTVTSDNSLFDSGNINNGSTYSRQFTTAGTFNYHCTIHPMMLGKVIVQ